MHGEIVEALAEKSAVEVKELMRNSLKGWKDDMLELLFSDSS
jgi:DNA-binding GntR family transcriptional regulator